MDRLLRILRYVWAAPYTALGLLLGAVGVLLGGSLQRERGVVEVSGGLAGRLLARLPQPVAFSAMTLGHVILAVDGPALRRLRSHELVHVRQYERWGPLFLPAYLLSSLFQLLRGRSPYRENHFERQAYAQSRFGSSWQASQGGSMDETSQAQAAARRIDLTRQTDVQFWCRVFDVSMDQLRDAVHHAGHQVEEVERYLRHKKESATH